MIGELREEDYILHPCVYKDGDFSIYIEDSTVGWIMHGYVYNWNKSIYWKLVDCLLDILEKAPRKELYAITRNDKVNKFATLLGFMSIDSFLDKEGEKIGELLCLTL